MLTQNPSQPKQKKVRATRKFYLVKRIADDNGASVIEHTVTEVGKAYTVDTALANELIGYNKAVFVDSPEDRAFMAAFSPEKPAKQSA